MIEHLLSVVSLSFGLFLAPARETITTFLVTKDIPNSEEWNGKNGTKLFDTAVQVRFHKSKIREYVW